MSRQNVLGTEKVSKLFWKLALPSVVAQVVNMLYNMVDRIYIGHIRDVGPLALTGVSISMSIIMLITAFVVLIGVGGAPRASIALGAGEKEKAEKVMNTAMSALVVTGLLLTSIFFGVYTNICLGHPSRYALNGAKLLYQRSRLCRNSNEDYSDRCDS
jgi:Na+-driven multidrug efflux pump